MRKTIKSEVKEIGELRTSQLITSYGVGAIVDFKQETAILASADEWRPQEDDDERILHCHNLEKILDRQFFVKPKCDSKNRAVYKKGYSHDIGAYRFPQMLYCPSCTHLCSDFALAGLQKGELKCPYCGKRLVPSRFVVVCCRGHIDDFPYSSWVHEGKTCMYAEDGRPSELKLFNINGRTNLGSLMVSCEKCGKIRSMQQAFVPEALASVYKCTGHRPWLERDDPNNCPERPIVRMRTAAGVYMAVNVSALNIPPWSTNISKLLMKHLDAMEGKNDMALRNYVQKRLLPFLPGVTSDQVLATYNSLISSEQQQHPTSLKELYEEEYQALCEEADDEKNDFCSRKLSVPYEFRSLISNITAVDRLTEIVTMVGFTRLRAWDGNLDSPYLAPIFSKEQTEWLPAIDMHGEGIFIGLNEEKVAEWEQKNNKIYQPMMERIINNQLHCENASPRYVLLHTLSHLLIRELAHLCGYQISSLKERIYSTYDQKRPMAGILIYTASSDAEGSLGGLVAQAEPTHIAEVLSALLDEAEWCSGDPLCMASSGNHGQGLYGLNYAACHQCTLLPETSCTMYNLLLDRAALIGRAEDNTIGYFR